MNTLASTPTLARKSPKMTTITDAIYRRVAQELYEAIGEGEFFNGRVEYAAAEEGFHAELTATLIIYRTAGRIKEVVPVWWEFHLTEPKGEVMTDFSWSELVDFMKDYY